jgi:hypothetical protein
MKTKNQVRPVSAPVSFETVSFCSSLLLHLRRWFFLLLTLWLFRVPLPAQVTPSQVSVFQGSVNFSYSGSLTGTFSAASEDSLSGAVAGLLAVGDSTYIALPAFQQSAPNVFDLFVLFLLDTAAPVEPQTWTLPPTDPLNPDAALFFAPDIDSATVMSLVDAFTDSALAGDSLQALLTNLLIELADVVYIATSGTISIAQTVVDTLKGTFQGTLMQATFPPPTIIIPDGQFTLARVDTFFIATRPEPARLPTALTLHPAYPNPFNARTRIRWSLEQPAKVRIAIYDLQGRELAVLVSGIQEAGQHTAVWDSGRYPSGIYLVRLVAGPTVLTRKVVLLK